MRVLASALLLLLPGLGCGGSSSETPPPLEPDPTSARYVGPRLPTAEDVTAPSPAPEANEDDLPVKPRRPAAATWGSGKAAPSVAAPAPSMSSPTALPKPSAQPL